IPLTARSIPQMMRATISTKTRMTKVAFLSCGQSGHVTFFSSSTTSAPKARVRASEIIRSLRNRREPAKAVDARTPDRRGSLRFLVLRVRVAPRAVLAPLDPLGVLTTVLGRVVIPLLTLRAGQDDLVARHRASTSVSAPSQAAER